MSINKKNILLITYVFPPYPGIAGRRWAKFAKYLVRNGFTVYVICSRNPFNEYSLWNSDVSNNENIIIIPLAPRYPSVLQTKPVNLFQKIQYLFWLKILPFFSKGTIYDKAVFWQKELLYNARKIIKEHDIVTVICSGAPFNLNYFSTKLKKYFPSLRLISDLRDPWTWGHGYGYPFLSASKKTFEKKKESTVIAMSDYVTVPAEVMKQHLQNEYPTCAQKIILLPHAFDPDEISCEKKLPNEKLRLIFYGSIYDHLDKSIELLCEVFKNNIGKVQLDFYTDSTKYRAIFESYRLGNIVSYHSPLDTKLLFAKFKNYDYVLLMYPDYAINYLSTKIFEVIATNTPFLYVGNHGNTSEFIFKNKLGIHILPNEIKTGMQKIIDNKNMLAYNYNFDVSAFSFSEITNNLIELI